MKRVIFGFLFFVLFSFSTWLTSGLELSEVMPDCGNLSANCEFIEFYSQEVQDLKGYLLDTQGQKLNLNVSFQGFLIITKHKGTFLERFGDSFDHVEGDGMIVEWRGMGLANGGDAVVLLQGNTTLTSFSYASSKKNMSWQKISEWKECTPTPFKENVCPALSTGSIQPLPSQPPQNQQNLQTDTLQNTQKKPEHLSNDSLANQSAPQKLQQNKSTAPPQENARGALEDSDYDSGQDSTDVEPSIIHLTGKDIKTAYTSRNEKIKEYAVYGFALFCVLFIILLVIKRN